MKIFEIVKAKRNGAKKKNHNSNAVQDIQGHKIQNVTFLCGILFKNV